MPQEKFFPTLFQHLATDTARNLVISAGAGAGKTAVLTRRVIKILREERLHLDRLMVVTFTDKAAVEMKERVYGAIDREIEKTGAEHFKKLRDDFLKNRISTFHAFCAALLREYPIEARIDPYFRVLDETDKIFFLRRIIERSISEMAENKEHPDLSVLSVDWSRAAIASVVYAIIQKREHTGPWLRDFINMEWDDYDSRLKIYYRNFVRELCFKLGRSRILEKVLELLKSIEPYPADDTSRLSLRRIELIELLPLLQAQLLTAKNEDFNVRPVIDRINQLLEQCNLSGATAKAWADDPERLDQLRLCFYTIRNVLAGLNLEELEINPVLEKEGFKISKALARITTYCLDAYREEKEKEKYLDFQDLQIKVLALLKSPKHAHILQELRAKYLYIMVDEFQDTNALQWDIVKLIASDDKEKLFGDRLFIVGDQKQAIYSFRGGDVTLFGKVARELVQANQERKTNEKPFILLPSVEVNKDYSQEYSEKIQQEHTVKAGEIIFCDNFRSAAEPIRFFNLLFQELMGKEYYEDFEAPPQQLICSGNKRQGSVELLLVDRKASGPDEALPADSALEDIDQYTKEAHLIAAKIKEVLAGDDPFYEYIRKEAAAARPAIAILLNRRTKLKTYEEALRRENIDFIVVRGRGFFQRQEIMDLGSLLGFLVDRSNAILLAGFLRSPVAHVSDEALFVLSNLVKDGTLWNKLCHLGDSSNDRYNENFTPEDYSALKNAHYLLTRWYFLSRRMILVDFLRLVLDEGGYYASLARGNRGEQAISNIEKLMDRAREATLSAYENLLTFTQWLNERIDFVDEEGEADVNVVLGGAVQLMTVHQSKGLEFPMVFVPDLTAFFNFGDREALRFDDVAEKLQILEDETILRTMNFEIGIEAPDPLNNFEPTPTLVKKIIEKRNREKVIAERKRLLYVAATRAMDHLVLVGQLKSRDGSAALQEEAATFEDLRCWMDWLRKILKLSTSIKGNTGKVILGDEEGEHMEIPYRLFDESQSVLSFEEQLRTEFPI